MAGGDEEPIGMAITEENMVCETLRSASVGNFLLAKFMSPLPFESNQAACMATLEVFED